MVQNWCFSWNSWLSYSKFQTYNMYTIYEIKFVQEWNFQFLTRLTAINKTLIQCNRVDFIASGPGVDKVLSALHLIHIFSYVSESPKMHHFSLLCVFSPLFFRSEAVVDYCIESTNPFGECGGCENQVGICITITFSSNVIFNFLSHSVQSNFRFSSAQIAPRLFSAQPKSVTQWASTVAWRCPQKATNISLQIISSSGCSKKSVFGMARILELIRWHIHATPNQTMH